MPKASIAIKVCLSYSAVVICPTNGDSDMAPKIDIYKLSIEERRQLLADLKGTTNWRNDADYVKRCIDMRAKLEEQCRKHGVSLAHVFTASTGPKPAKKGPVTYRHGEKEYTTGRGRKPGWFANMSEKEKEAARVK